MRGSHLKIFILSIYTIFILSISFYSPSMVVNSSYIGKYDKFFHFIEFSILGFLFANANSFFNRKTFFLGLLYILVIGFFDEFIQSYRITRNADVIDFFYDVFGGMVGMLFNLRFKK